MSEVDHNTVKSAIEEQGKAFEEFKATNDQRIADLEKKVLLTHLLRRS